MKILVVSDIHGSLLHAQKAIEAFETHQADMMLMLGDFLYHGPRNPLPPQYDPMAVSQLLNRYADRILAVRGNCDSEVDQMILDFEIMAPYTMVLNGSRRLFATHGHLYDLQQKPAQIRSGDAYLFGHIHLPLATVEIGIYVLNPGSISLPKQNNPHTYGLLDQQGFTILTEDHQVFNHIDFD